MREKSPRRPGPLLAVGALALVALAFSWYFRPAAATTDPSQLVSDAGVLVAREPWGLLFQPAAGSSQVGLVLYPGARVPPEAYAYLARGLASAGYTSAIVGFPLGFAIFNPSRAGVVVKALPEIKAWVIGGHSLGGAMAAAYCAKSPGTFSGLLLLASYPGGGTDLSSTSLAVLSVSASNDGLATPAKIQSARPLLPAAARFVEISGGTHAQFGEYGLQAGDGSATVDAATQRRAVVEEASGLMDSILAGLR